MNEQQINRPLNVLATQTVLLYGIQQSLQAINIKNGAQPGAYNFKDAQKLFEATAASVKIPG